MLFYSDLSMRLLTKAIKFMVLTLSLLGCSSSPTNGLGASEIYKSPADPRLYRSVVLNNGLKVMLVSDPTATRAAAALDVHVGSGHDPKGREGLAHYVEHMLFLGTEKYPEAGEYQKYINEHGGSNNAYTSLEHTNYFFTISPNDLEPALDRFSQFFISPLFNPEYLKRERTIVHSEYAARKKDESRRLWTARRVVYNAQHPSTRFTVGSEDTLADRENDPVRDDVLMFYQRYYHASRMALSVVSSQSLDQLQAWVEAKFSPIKTGDNLFEPFNQPLIDKKSLPLQLTIKPLKESRSLTFSFPIPSVSEYVDSKPIQYIGNLVGHEGEGSLLAALKIRDWANSLSVSLGYSDKVQATFDIKIGLSELGFNHVQEIGEQLFSTIKLIIDQGVKPTYFEEIKQLTEIGFRFQEISSEGSLVQYLAPSLHRYDAKDVLSTPYLITKYEPSLLVNILQRLNPLNCQLIIVDPDLESNQTTDWYHVDYAVDTIKPSWLNSWQQAEPSKEIFLPKANSFVPESLVLIKDTQPQETIPVLIGDSLSLQVWHQTILTYKQPKAELYLSLRSKQANASAQQAMLTELYVMAVKEALSQEYYPAYLAGLNYRIYRHSRGLSVRLGGYSEKQSVLLESIIGTLKSLPLEPSKFSLFKENIQRRLENKAKNRPSSLASEGVFEVLLSSSWSTEEKLVSIKSITLEMLEAHIQDLLQNPELILLSVGNVTKADTLRAANIVNKLIVNQQISKPVSRARIRKLQAGEWLLRPVKATHDDAAILLLYQGHYDTVAERAAMQLLGVLIQAPYHRALRTESEIGYIVSAFALNLLDVPGLAFSVQSNTHSVNEIVLATMDVMRDFTKTLEGMSLLEFNATKAGLISRLSQIEKGLNEVAGRYWTELDRKAYTFDTRDRVIEAIKDLDKSSLQDYFHQLVNKDQAAVLMAYSLGNHASDLAAVKDKSSRKIVKLAELREQWDTFY